MQITVSGKNFDIGEAIQDHARDELDAITAKYFDQAVDAAVVFTKEGKGPVFGADITVHVGHNITVRGEGSASEAYAAYAVALDKVEKRLRRYKNRLRDHHRKEADKVAEAFEAHKTIFSFAEEKPVDASADAENGEATIIAEMRLNIETLSVADAVMRLDLADLPALMFRNKAHGELNMVYRRPDGNISWVDPKGASAKVA